MLRSLCNKKGVGLIEVLIAIFLTATGIMAVLSLQPQGWRTMAKADYIGRASGILYKTLQNYETIILNPCIAIPGTSIPALGAQPVGSIKVSGQGSAISGDITYTVNTSVTINTAGVLNVTPQVYLVTVTVRWPPINTTGITESQLVTTQDAYAFPKGCIHVR
jgi:Tfp pilus assembly protein PilV